MQHCAKDKEYEDGMQKEVLKQFKKAVADVLSLDDTDAILMKWLRAKNFNLKKCEVAYRENIWLKQIYKLGEKVNAEQFLKPEVVKYEFFNYIGIAKDDTPICYLAVGRGDMKGLLMCADTFGVGKYGASKVEAGLKICKEQSRKLNKDINKITFILDMENFCIRQILHPSVIESGFDFLRMLQDHYPEVWNYILIINVPAYFYTAFHLFKPILRNILLKDIHVAPREQTARLLLKYVDAEILPCFLGGTRVDSQNNPSCKEFMKFGGIIPEEFYLRNYHPLQPTDVGAEQVWISARCTFNYSVVIQQPNSIIHFEFRTENGSILFCALYRKFGSNPDNPDIPSRDEYLDETNEKCNVEMISPHAHSQAHLCPVNNFCHAPRTGIYIFKFDNSRNWLCSRKLIYRFRIELPDAPSFPNAETGMQHKIGNL